MSTELILQNVTRYIHLNEDEKTYFLSLLHPKSIKRKQFALEYGQICKHSIFVTSGCLRGFTVDEMVLSMCLILARRVGGLLICIAW